MGKKTRSAPGRRPILQLSPPGPRGEPGEGEEEEHELTGDMPGLTAVTASNSFPKPVVKATGGLCLLGAYADSDDEEDAAGEHAEKSKPSRKANGNTSGDIGSTLADFLAEIDAITAPPPPEQSPTAICMAPPPTPPRPEPVVLAASENGVESAAEAEWQYNTQCSLSGVDVEMGDWQEVWDENTGCHYYWNTQTNEVTWELPPYLATQVQGLQNYQQSSVAAEESYPTLDLRPPELNDVGKTADTFEKEHKKDLNEAVHALSNMEEEKLGVAASLLAPLLPESVKEEEQRWRMKLLNKEDVPQGAEEDDEASVEQEPLVSTEYLDDASREDPCSVVQSGESEEEEEQDTLELEMVLERKKAELRALEEGDGSVCGSSPCSEGNGTAAVVPVKAKWKIFVPAASPESNSRSSSKTGCETPENLENGSSDAAVENVKKPDLVGVQDKNVLLKPEDEVDLKIGELANLLTSKLEFLGINRQSVSNFHVLLFQTETRIADWREGALNGNYLKQKLQDAAEQIRQYEINATPKGWSCHWDREHRRYFYLNEQTGESQWEFPDVEEDEEQLQHLKQTHPPFLRLRQPTVSKQSNEGFREFLNLQ